MTGFLLVAATSAPPRPSSPLTVMEATTLSRASPTVSPYYSERSSYSQKSNNIASCYCYIDYNSRNSLIGTTPNKTKRSRLFFSVMASSFNTSSGDRKRNNKNDNTAAATAKAKSQAMELQRIFEDDSQSRPKPLSVTDVSNFVVHGSSLRVAYQGVPGAYSESAAEKAYPNCEAVPCEQFDTAFDAVERWLVDRAVLPIENSLGGSIHRNYDLLLRHSLHIVGEVRLSVRHCLLANHDVRLEDLKRVLSHPQALAQCENTLTKLGVVREAVDDTAGAAQYVALHNLQDAGAVASSGAAKIYGLNILAHDIQDYSDNVTRFLMLAREPIIPGTDRPFKTSIVFSLEQGPGVLFKALAVFAMRNINLTKIESRPRRRQPFNDTSSGSQQKCFDYLFYVDFEASMADPNSQNALRHLEVDSHRVLGLPCFLVRCRRKQSVPF